MAYGGCDVDYLQGFAKLSIDSSSKKLVEIAQGKRGKNLCIREELFNKLYDYQKEGVRWLFGLYEKGKGGILGDDMGLGKTIQMIAFLSGMMDCNIIRCALIIAPMSVINVWCNSFKEFSPRTNLATFHGEKRAREKALERIQDRGGVLLTTYDLVGREGDRLGRDGYGDNFEWDYVIADEGHQLKNKSIKRSQGAHSVPTKYRIILTGTPLQNKLPELWALFDFTHFGQLLGTMRTFNSNYGNAIEEGRKKCASAHARRLGNEFAESLRKIIEPYLLRRTKDEVGLGNRPISSASQQRGGSSASDGSASPAVPRQVMPSLPRKNDLVIWLTLSKEQEDIYRRFLTTPEVKMLLDPSVKTSPLTQLIVLKKLCDHPRLLSENACQTLGITFDRNMGEQQTEQQAGLGSTLRLPSANTADGVGDQDVDDLAMCIDQSIKTSFLKELLPQLVNEGHKVLVFSMSLKMLNLVAQILKSRLGIKFLRLDGRVTKLEERQKILEKYQTSDRYKVLLLTTQVGGVGLTITAADRVVIVDPAWNPAVDSQAVDRVYRVGQTRNVVIYRLITAGTVEEKIYRRQVFKVSIFKQIAHSSRPTLATNAMDDPMRYFTHQDLKELFKLNDTKSSDTQRQLEDKHAHQRNSDENLDQHIGFVTGLRGVVGISDHDLLFTRPDDPTELENGDEEMRARQVVQRAKMLIEEENRNPNAGLGGGDAVPRNRHPLSEKQQPDFDCDDDDIYPRGFGEVRTVPSSQGYPFGKPQPDAPSIALPNELPLYLQRKGLIKPGQTVLTPPKPLGQKDTKGFSLHRSYSDGELNAAVDNEVIVLDDDDDDAKNKGDNDETDETISLEESLIQQNRTRKVNRIEDSDTDSESYQNVHQPKEGSGNSRESRNGSDGSLIQQTRRPNKVNAIEDDDVEVVEHKPNEESSGSLIQKNTVRKAKRIVDDSMEIDVQKGRNSSYHSSQDMSRQPEVIDLDSDEDEVQIVEQPPINQSSKCQHSVRLESNTNSSAHDSIIKGWKGKNRKIIDDDSEDEDMPPLENLGKSSDRAAENNSTTSKTAIVSEPQPTSVIVVDENGKEVIPSSIVAGHRKLSRVSALEGSGETPFFGALPIISSTPFNPPPLLKPTADSGQRSFPSAITISPLTSNKNSRSTINSESGQRLSSVSNNQHQKQNLHGTKRSSFQRSLDDSDKNSKNQSTNIIPDSVVISDDDESTEEYDDDHTESTESTAHDEVVDETNEQSTEDYEEAESEENQVVGESGSQDTEEDSKFFKTATASRTYDEDEDNSESRISLPQGGDGDASFAY